VNHEIACPPWLELNTTGHLINLLTSEIRQGHGAYNMHSLVCIYFGSHTCISYLPEHSPTVHPLHLIFGLNHELHLTGALNYVKPSMGPTT